MDYNNSNVVDSNPLGKEEHANNWIVIIQSTLFIVAIATAVFAVFGNILSIWVLLRTKPKTPNILCVLSLSTWDLLVCLALILFIITIRSAESNVWQTRFEVLGDFCVKGSTYTTVVISIQRVIAVFIPLRCSSIVTNKRTSAVCFGIVPTLILLEAIIFGEKPFGNLLLYYLPPGLLLLGCNLAIVVKLFLIERQRQNITQSERKNRKATVMLLLIAGIHILYLTLVLLTVNTSGEVQQWFTLFLLNIIVIRPFSNVIIYFVFRKTMRESCQKVCCCCCHYFAKRNLGASSVETGSSQVPQ